MSIERTASIRPGNEQSIAALFMSEGHATALLDEIAKGHALCRYILGLEIQAPCSGVHKGTCNGACTGKERSRHHNKRFRDAFEHHRIKPWPFGGPVAVEERRKDGTGEMFILDGWRLLAALEYDGTEWREFIPARFHFDYDVYKVFSRELLKKRVKVSVRELTNGEEAFIRGEHSIIE